MTVVNRAVTPQAQIVQRFYDALAAGDVAGMATLFASEIEWTEAERFPYYGGTWRTLQAVVDNLFAPIGRDWEGFTAAPARFVTEHHSVVSFGTYRGTSRASGRQLDAPFAHLWTVRDGRITGFVQYTDTAKVLEAAGPVAPAAQRRAAAV